MERVISLMKTDLRLCLRSLLAHPFIVLAAAGAWGWQALEIADPALGFITTIVGWVFTAAFFGLAGARIVHGERITWKTLLMSIRQLTVGTVFITMVYTLPLLLVIPVVDWLVGGSLRGNPLVVIVGFAPTVVPSLAATWSLAARRTRLNTALADGLSLLKGKWGPALLTGVVYQSLAYGMQMLREWLLTVSVFPLVLEEIVWIGFQGIFRLWVLFWLFAEMHERS